MNWKRWLAKSESLSDFTHTPQSGACFLFSYFFARVDSNTLVHRFFNQQPLLNLTVVGRFNTIWGMPRPKKIRQKCLCCEKETARAGYTYCSNACQLEYQRQDYLKNWKEGKVSGLQSLGIVSVHIKRFLRKKYDDKCCLCGWSKINPKTGVVPLVADHIDGNWRNNVEINLRLICPNCDSLTATYAGLNRGNGRRNRVLSKRAKEGRLLSARNKPI